MIDVSVTVSGIIMCCDENIAGINFGKDYSIKKIKFDELPFKENITDGKGQLAVDYFGSRLFDDVDMYFMCIYKDGTFQIEGPQLDWSKRVFTDKDFDCQDQLQGWKDSENEYLHKIVAMMHLFKAGNIGFRDVFFHFEYSSGIMNNRLNHIIHNETRNIIGERKYTLTEEETNSCNTFLTDFFDAPYRLLKPSIDEFVWGLEQIDIPTGFEQYTTALEMTLLEQNQRNKKQTLSNRVAVLIGKDNADIQQLHQKMQCYYRFRSESLHEGDGSNISDSEFKELEEIVRSVLKKCLLRCKTEHTLNANISWEEIKNKMINDLKAQVVSLKSQGVLPT